MSPTGVFIDGPLRGEVMTVTPTPTFHVMLPARATVCNRDPGAEERFDYEAERVTYYVIMQGLDGHVVMLSTKTGSDAIISSLKSWVESNFQAERWYKNCRDEGAWE